MGDQEKDSVAAQTCSALRGTNFPSPQRTPLGMFESSFYLQDICWAAKARCCNTYFPCYPYRSYLKKLRR